MLLTGLPFPTINSGDLGNQELIQLLMQALEGMKQKAFDNMKTAKKNSQLAEERAQEIERLKQHNEDLALR